MPDFCTKCGSKLSGFFCGKCGADSRRINSQIDAQNSAAEPQTPLPPVAAIRTTTATGSSAVKILICFAVVVGAMGAGGVYYVAHRTQQTVHELRTEIPAFGLVPGNGTVSTSNTRGDGQEKKNPAGTACRYLSAEDVSKAIGIEIVATQSESDNDCSYLAHGNSADMTAKHMSAMAGAKGADAQTQKITEQFAGGLFKSLQNQQGDSNQDSAGNVPVFSFAIDTNAAEAQMRLNAKVVGNLGPAPQELPGIGNQGFDMAGAMVMMRKGDKLVRIMYSMCPCTVEAIKPLAKKLADSM